MDLFATLGCDFLKVDVGFQPNNKTSVFNLGFWYYTSLDTNDSKKGEVSNPLLIFEQCASYPEDFYDSYIRDDPSWRATKIIAWASAIGSLSSLVSIFVKYRKEYS